MANLEWTKTARGYAAGNYVMARTAGKRWVVCHNDVVLADGKHYPNLAEAKQCVTDNEAIMAVTPVVVDAPRDVLGYPIGQTQLTPADWGVEQRSDFPIQSTTGSLTTPGQQAVITEGDNRPDPTLLVTTESVPTTATAAPPAASTANDFSIGFARDVLIADAKFVNPVPRESLTDQFTRLLIYKDIGIVRRALRNSA